MISCKEYVELRKEQLKNWNIFSPAPTLAIVQFGAEFASNKYVAGKLKDCKDVGIVAKHIKIPWNAKESVAKKLIETGIRGCDGVIIQLPVPEHINADKLLELVKPEQDVDGFKQNSPYTACTPRGIMTILWANGIELDGANVTIIGRGKTVGKPLMDLMLAANATVTVCHSHTENLTEHCINADIIISAVGRPNVITADMVKEGAVVIDVGIHRDENGKQIGDCDYPNLKDKCKFITPWVGGIGLLTRLSLLENVMMARGNKTKRGIKNDLLR